MDTQHLLNVLNMLRALKAKKLDRETGASIIKEWTGGSSEGLLLKAAANLQDEIELAYTSLKEANVSDEAKDGILPKLIAMRNAFSIAELNNTLANNIYDVPGMISAFSMLLDAAGVQPQAEAPAEVADLISDIEICIKNLDENMDPVVRAVAIKHMQILVAMLQNLHLFGAEAAYAAYFELMAKVQRADSKSSTKDQGTATSLIQKLKTWSDIVSTVQKLWDSGSGIVTSAAKMVPLLSHNSG